MWLLTFVPKIGKDVAPFVPKIQEGVRNLVDMLGGKIIQSKVEDKVNELLNSIEENINTFMTNYKTNLLADYEHHQLGAIRSELVSLENLLQMNKDQKENIEDQVKYYQKSKNTLNEVIEKLLIENNR